MTRDDVLQYAREKYGTTPEFPWRKFPAYTVLRHRENRRWYGLLMQLPKNKLGLKDAAPADVLNLKCDPLLIGSLRRKTGVFPAYHQNKEHWLSVLLEQFPSDEELCGLIDLSYQLTL